jgi:HK97 family phage portal protein
MSLFFQRSTATLQATMVAQGVDMRSAGKGAVATSDTALRHSAVWACLRLRADLVSTTPLDVFRRVKGVQIEMPRPPLFSEPGGPGIELEEWLYSSQMDLDRFGNTVGVITERDGLGKPRRIELAPMQDVSVHVRQGMLDHYRIAGTKYDPSDIWHEKQFTVPGLAVGLSPVAYAAWSLGTYLSAQEFALAWFDSDAAPAGHLRNTLKPTVDEPDAKAIKARFKNAVRDRDIFVTGRDWEYTFQQVPANTVMFLEQQQYGVADAARFFGAPGDLIGAETSTGSITYASITQRNLQLLIMNLGPVFVRREKALSRAIYGSQYAKFTTDATVLRMDPEARSKTILAKISGRALAPSEARELDNLPPFTDEQLAEFDRLFGAPRLDKPADKIGAPA